VTELLVPPPSRLLLVRSLFSVADREVHPVREGRTIAEMLVDVGAPVSANLLVMVDDQEVPRASWDAFKPAAGSFILARAVPGDPATLGINYLARQHVSSQVYGMWMMLTFAGAAVVSAGALAPMGMTAVFAAQATLGVVGNLAMSALVRPPTAPKAMRPSTRGQDLIAGTRNRLEPYAVVPMACGSTRYVPPQAMAPYSEVRSGKTYVTQMFDFGRGPIDFSDLKIGPNPVFTEDKVLLYDRVMQADGYYRKIEVELRRGTPTDAPLTLVIQEVHEEPLSIELLASAVGPGPTTSRNTLPNTTEISIDLTWQGLVTLHNAGAGTSATVAVRIVYRNLATGVSTTINTSTSRATTGLVRLTKTWAVPAGQYAVTLQRTTIKSTNPKVIDKTIWSALRSKRAGDPLKDAGHARIVTRITGTEQVNGTIDELSAFVERYAKAWNGSTWALAKTRDPMAYFRLVLQDADNRLAISDADLAKRVDLPRLQEVSVACVAQRRAFDFVFDDEATVLDRLKTIAAACRGSFIVRDGKFSIVLDDPAAPNSGVYTPLNMWGFRWRKTFPLLPHGLKVRFQDPLKDWSMNERIVFDDGYSAAGGGGTQVGTKFDEMSFAGVIDASILWADARYHLAVNRLRTLVCQWNTDWYHSGSDVGDRCSVSHDSISKGLATARVQRVITNGSGHVTAVEVDQIFAMETAKTYALRIDRSVDRVNVVKTLTTVVGDQTVVSFAAAITVAGEKPSVGDLVVFGLLGSETQEMIITEIRPGADLAALVTAVPVAAAVYDAALGARPDWAGESIYGAVPPDSRVPFDAPKSLQIAGVATNKSGTMTLTFAQEQGRDPVSPGR